MKNTQITKHTFAAIGRRMLHRLSRHLIPNVGTIVIVALLLFAYHAWAAPSAAPQVAPASQVNTGMLSYQGYLTDASGEPLTGDVDITFRLYDAPSGGAALWTEVHTNANAVPVADGLFNVMLGSLTPISSTVWSSGTSYLGVQVGNDAEMSPREAIGNVPTAMTVPDGAIGTAQIAADAVKTTQIADRAVTASKVTLPHGYIVGDIVDQFSLTTSHQTVPGLSFTVNASTPQILHLNFTLDAVHVSTSGPIVGHVSVDGNIKGRPVVLAHNDVRATISSSIQANLSPGTHTIEIQAWVPSGSGSYLYPENSVVTYSMFSQ